MISDAGKAITALAEKLRAPAGDHAARQGRRRRDAPAAPRHDGHARHRLREQGGGRLRPDHGDRRALGRPHHGPRLRLLPQRRQDPRRHRRRRVQQDHPARRGDPRRRAARDRGPDPAGRDGRHRGVARSSATAGAGMYPLKYPKQGGLRAQHVLDRLRRAHAGRRDPHHRRGPAPDVGGAVLPRAQQPALALERRRGNDGLRLARRDRRAVRQSAARRSGRSSATAASR